MGPDPSPLRQSLLTGSLSAREPSRSTPWCLFPPSPSSSCCCAGFDGSAWPRDAPSTTGDLSARTRLQARWSRETLRAGAGAGAERPGESLRRGPRLVKCLRRAARGSLGNARPGPGRIADEPWGPDPPLAQRTPRTSPAALPSPLCLPSPRIRLGDTACEADSRACPGSCLPESVRPGTCPRGHGAHRRAGRGRRAQFRDTGELPSDQEGRRDYASARVTCADDPERSPAKLCPIRDPVRTPLEGVPAQSAADWAALRGRGVLRR